jgi:hypothetical protein
MKAPPSAFKCKQSFFKKGASSTFLASTGLLCLPPEIFVSYYFGIPWIRGSEPLDRSEQQLPWQTDSLCFAGLKSWRRSDVFGPLGHCDGAYVLDKAPWTAFNALLLLSAAPLKVQRVS